MYHPTDALYPPFRVGGIIPDKYNHRFTVAHKKLCGRVENIDEVLADLWAKASLETKNVRKAWMLFTLAMSKKVEELDADSNGTLL